MKKNFKIKFVPEDFCDYDGFTVCFHTDGSNLCPGISRAAKANARLAELLPDLKKQWLEELLAGAPVMEVTETEFGWFGEEIRPEVGPTGRTHTARLVCIKELGSSIEEIENK
jgi:hypothetical protein